MNEKDIETLVEGLKLVENFVLKTNEINKRIVRIAILTFIISAILICIVIISRDIRDSNIAKSYFNQSYSQTIKSDKSSMSQELGGDVK